MDNRCFTLTVTTFTREDCFPSLDRFQPRFIKDKGQIIRPASDLFFDDKLCCYECDTGALLFSYRSNIIIGYDGLN